MVCGLNSKAGNIPGLVNDLIYLTEQALSLLGQRSNTIFYHRRRSVIFSLMKPLQANCVLQEKAATLKSQNTDLFE